MKRRIQTTNKHKTTMKVFESVPRTIVSATTLHVIGTAIKKPNTTTIWIIAITLMAWSAEPVIQTLRELWKNRTTNNSTT